MCASVVLGFVFPYQAVFSNQHSRALNVGYSVWQNSEAHTTAYLGDRFRPRRICVRWGPRSPSPWRGL